MSEKIQEALLNFADAMENAALVLKQAVGKTIRSPQISEEPFLALKWEKRTGNRIKEFEVTTKTLNSGSDDFHRCLNILKQNRATIQSRFRYEGWRFAYWIYGESIYRQPIKA